MNQLPLEVVVPPVRLDTTTKDGLTQQVKQIASQKATLVLLDFSQVEFVDSSGLGAMVAALKSLRSVGGELALCQPSEQVKTLLEITGLERIIKIYPNREVFDQEYGK
ncbi:STAS domain-containing protein [Gloeomargaritales cyanobacterium VI4D9]|jgi:anti-anti-sigma factor|nr:STAS domain-containing protein [Gloeomargaritales cyanobacterium VI4D9]